MTNELRNLVTRLREMEGKVAVGPWRWSCIYQADDGTMHWAVTDPESDKANLVTDFRLVSMAHGKLYEDFPKRDAPRLLLELRNAFPTLADAICAMSEECEAWRATGIKPTLHGWWIPSIPTQTLEAIGCARAKTDAALSAIAANGKGGEGGKS